MKRWWYFVALLPRRAPPRAPKPFTPASRSRTGAGNSWRLRAGEVRSNGCCPDGIAGAESPLALGRAGSAKRPRRRLGEAGDGLVLCVVRFEDRVECGGVEQSPQMRTNVRELEGPTVGCRGLVTLDDLAQARAVYLLQVRDVQQNPTLAAMEKSNHPLCERRGSQVL
jgi:hypothetical protein